MIDVSEVANGVLVSAIGATGKWLATAARAPRGRKAEDLSIARWFETYKLTGSPPDLSGLSADDAELVANALRGPAIQGTLQELLSARLTNAPESDVARAREAFCLTLTRAVPPASVCATALADYYDDEISKLVARLQANDPDTLKQIRSEALSARMIAVLNAIERHTAALQSSPRDGDTFLSAYRRQVIDHHGKLQPPDFDRRRRVPIEEIYVPGTIYQESSTEQAVDSSDPPPSLTIWELAACADRTVLLGDPGGGKTTASNVLMHRFASDESFRVPFLVTLRDFASEDPPSRSVVSHIEHDLETFYQCPAPPGLVSALLLIGRAIVFFDGLDELLDPARRAGVAERVERFCTEYPLVPVLVTSRVVGYDQARLDDRQFTCYRLGGFSDENVRDYARKWFALEDGCQPEDADTFLTESESVPDLRTNPLLLSLMCILYRGEGSLPRNRAEVYEQCANLLFRKWDARRKIHTDLRAAHLLEPALRHLAWWLFTREDSQPAVTERELISETTEFLHGRGFEAIDDARDAAREFIEFCRGRMWVFSDTGTTATGENLYSFTHRTFLEYFAAAHLAYNSDTPEKLARIILPHVARGEWEVVAELAVQMKDRTSADGAQRIYERLLKDRRYSSRESRSNILQFLARALRSVKPPPQVIRYLTRNTINFLFSSDPGDPTHYLPTSCLITSCGGCLSLVGEEVAAVIADMIASKDYDKHLNGILLAMTLDTPARKAAHETPDTSRIYRYWEMQAKENRDSLKTEITTAAHNCRAIFDIAVTKNVFTVEQALKIIGDFTSMIEISHDNIFNITTGARLHSSISTTVNYSGKSADLIPEEIQDIAALGRHLISQSRPPWTRKRTNRLVISSIMRAAEPRGTTHPHINPYAYLGASAVILIEAESHRQNLDELQELTSFQFGPFSALHPYIVRRHDPTQEISIPELPVPDDFKQIFRDWAENKINFVTDPQVTNSNLRPPAILSV